MSELELDARQLTPSPLQLPVSKSDAIRALILADVLGRAAPDCGDPPADVVAVQRGLPLLGTGEVIDCGDGAAPLRCLVGQAALTPGVSRFTGSARLRERPHGPLLQALRQALGAGAVESGDGWPVVVRGVETARARTFAVDAGASSQFATSLLLAAARGAHRDGAPWAVDVNGLASPGYLALTLKWLRRAGFAVDPLAVDPQRTSVMVRSAEPPSAPWWLPGDWSSAGYLLVCAWRSGGSVEGLSFDADHPDQVVVDLLGEVGLQLEPWHSGSVVRGTPTRGLSASAKRCPDLIPTLAALACALPGPSTFEDLAILRTKESDRVAGTCALLDAAGARWTLSADTLRVEPLASTAPELLIADSRGDHRMAMAAATLAVVLQTRLRLSGFACVGKSFPGFFKELSRAGAILWYSNPAELNMPGTGMTQEPQP